MHKLGPGIFILLGLLLLPGGCASPDFRVSDTAPVVRVQLLANQQQVTLSSTASAALKPAGASQVQHVSFGSGAIVTLTPGGWRIGNATYPPGELLLEPSQPGSAKVNGTGYRGRYRFVPTGQDRFDVINDVDIDSYLMGVIPRELLADWHIETYKAQTIIARTYALFEVRTASQSRHFDLFDDDRSQVYGGYDAESDKSRRAVAQTGGVVAAYGPQGSEKIFKAYFSSCCGGVGQSAYDAFGDTNIPPMRERSVGRLCSASSRYNWAPVVLSKQELTRRIRTWGARRNAPEKDLGLLRSIEIAAVNQFQRPVRFYITDSKGLRYSLTGEEIRWACNADASGGPTLFSSYFKPVVTEDAIHFTEGHGWGHGAGMCQWCAQALAAQGKQHEQIVRFSYPGAVLVRAY
jgi:stage II sporulation protein D